MFRQALVMLGGPLAARLTSLSSRLAAAGIAALPPVRAGRGGQDAVGLERIASAWADACDIIVLPSPAADFARAMAAASGVAIASHRPVLVVPTDRIDEPEGGEASQALLDHVEVLADYAFDAPCAHACTARLAAQGARRVTLHHIHGLRPPAAGGARRRGELQWIDFVRVEVLKDRLLVAGAEQVVFKVDEHAGFTFADDATMVVLSGHCRPETIDAFAARVAVHQRTGAQLPAVLLPSGACCPVAGSPASLRPNA